MVRIPATIVARFERIFACLVMASHPLIYLNCVQLANLEKIDRVPE
jgi:hypothetical protein